VLGVGFYLAGGRYISTDNAYVGAQKVLITPDISGKVQGVLVREGQHVGVNDPLFEIDPVLLSARLEAGTEQGRQPSHTNSPPSKAITTR
jgi:multidrug resistance efflux pump